MHVSNILDHIQNAHGEIFYQRLLESFYQQVKADYLFIARVDSSDHQAQTISVLVDGEPSENFSYPLGDTPCEDISRQKVCVIPDSVQQLYPQDQLLIDMGVQGYAGVPLFNEEDRVFGILVALFKKEVKDSNGILSLFRLFTGRLSAEIVREDALTKLKDVNNELESILNNLNDSVVTVNDQGIILSANSATYSMFGRSHEELIGRNVSLLMPKKYAKMHQSYMENYLGGGAARIIGVGRELPAQRKSGEEFFMELSLSELDMHGERIFVGIIKDITDRKRAMEDIYRLAYYDETTGIPNSKSFEKDIRKLINKAALVKGDIYCCLINLDQFSQYNVTYGKETGDFILQTVAQRIQSKLGKEFGVYRGLADSFLIVQLAPIIEASIEAQHELDAMIFKLQRFISADMVFHGLSHKINCRTSSVMIEATSLSYEQLVGMLEFGQKLGKKKGAGSKTSLNKRDFAEYDRNTFIGNSFGQAIRENEFYVALQPQLDHSGKVIASELLLRWEHGKLGNIRPDEFIPIAERSEDIIDISRWVMQNACRLLNLAASSGIKTRIAINVSGNHIARHDFTQDVLDCTEVWGIEPGDLILEITETAMVNNIELVRKHIDDLSEKGFCFSIDDFGTGYSSLSYLKELPIHELKIDRYFVNEIVGTEDVPIVNSIIDMAKALRLKTVAEGIETQIQLDYLNTKGCDYYQGYFFSKPIDEQSWLTFLKERK